jgi:hypothetical protein
MCAHSGQPCPGLLLYAQLAHAFGWDAFKIVFREYESLAHKAFLTDLDLSKWDEWIIRFSNVVGLDVSPLFLFWAVPFSDKTLQGLNDLTPWLPNDHVSQVCARRVHYVTANYKPGMLFGNEALYTTCPRKMYPRHSDSDFDSDFDSDSDSIEQLQALNANNISSF